MPFLVSDKKIKENIEKVTKANDKIKKNVSKQTAIFAQQRQEHEQYLDKTFFILSPNIEELLQACPARWEGKISDDLDMVKAISGENPSRQVSPARHDRMLQRIQYIVKCREEEAREGGTEEGGEAREGSSNTMEDRDESDALGDSINSESVEDEASTAASELEREDRRREGEKRKRRKKMIREEGIDAKVPHNLLELLSPIFTSHQISHNAATDIVAAVYRECNIDIDDEITISPTSSKRLRSRENNFITEKALNDLTAAVQARNIPLTLHYDTKALKQRMLEPSDHLPLIQSKRREMERLALVVTGPTLGRAHLLAVPGLEGGTAVEQAEAGYAVLQKCDLHNHIRDLVYDTPAVNTGRSGGKVRLLQLLLGGRACLCTPCRRHVAELIGKFATIGATGSRSQSPGDALFTRFRRAWPDIASTIDFGDLNNIFVTFNWERSI